MFSDVSFSSGGVQIMRTQRDLRRILALLRQSSKAMPEFVSFLSLPHRMSGNRLLTQAGQEYFWRIPGLPGECSVPVHP